ncbi:MAG: hypothetical protein K6G50_03115 [bacterium]|nr:hypothetical protein [bacterium]
MSEVTRCKNCGAIINDNEEYCSICRRAGYVPQQEHNEQDSSSSNSILGGMDKMLALQSFCVSFVIFALGALTFNEFLVKNFLHIDLNSTTAVVTIGVFAFLDVIITSIMLMRFSIPGFIASLIMIPIAYSNYTGYHHRYHHNKEHIIFCILLAAGMWIVSTIMEKRRQYLKKGLDNKANILTNGMIAAAALAVVILLACSAISIICMI